MNHRLLVCLSITLLILIDPSIKADDLFVINGLAETLSEVDLDEGTVQNNILTLGLYPNDIIIIRDSAYILNSGSDDLYVYDLIDQQLVNVHDIGSGRNPYRLIEVDTDTLLITNWYTSTLTKMTISGEIIGEYDASGDYPQGMLVMGDTTYFTTVAFVWQDTSYNEGAVMAWDNSGDSAVAVCPVGDNPNDLTLGPDGDLWVCCTGQYDGTGSVYIVDPLLMAVEDSILTGGDPTDIIITDNGVVFLAAGGGWWPSGSSGYLFTIDAVTRTLLHGSTDPILTDGGPMTVIAASDSTVFSFNFAANTVTEVDSGGVEIRSFDGGDGVQTGAIWFESQVVCEYARGDADGSGGIDIDDVVYLISYLFAGGPEPVQCKGVVVTDVNCSGVVDIDDIVYLIQWLYAGGPEPCEY